MSYIDEGFNKYLIKESVIPAPVQDAVSFDETISEISGSKIIDYASQNFNFIPTTPQVNPKEGNMYYDKTDRKIKVYTGSSYEQVTSS